MLKRLKRVFSTSERNDKKEQVVTSSAKHFDYDGDIDSTSKTDESFVVPANREAELDKVCLGFDCKRSISHQNHTAADITASFLYTTAVEEVDKQVSECYSHYRSSAENMGDSMVSDGSDQLCIPTNNKKAESNAPIEATDLKYCANNAPSSGDSLDDCLAAFESLSLNTPKPNKTTSAISRKSDRTLPNSLDNIVEKEQQLTSGHKDLSYGDYIFADKTNINDNKCYHDMNFSKGYGKHRNRTLDESLVSLDNTSDSIHLDRKEDDANAGGDLNLDDAIDKVQMLHLADNDDNISQASEIKTMLNPFELPSISCKDENLTNPRLPNDKSVNFSHDIAVETHENKVFESTANCKNMSVSSTPLASSFEETNLSEVSTNKSLLHVASDGHAQPHTSDAKVSSLPFNSTIITTSSSLTKTTEISAVAVSNLADSPSYNVKVYATSNAVETSKLLADAISESDTILDLKQEPDGKNQTFGISTHEKSFMENSDQRNSITVPISETVQYQNSTTSVSLESVSFPSDFSRPSLDISASDTPQKGSYSIDFSQIDGPNFDPFETIKSLSNDAQHVDDNNINLTESKEAVTVASFKESSFPNNVIESNSEVLASKSGSAALVTESCDDDITSSQSNVAIVTDNHNVDRIRQVENLFVSEKTSNAAADRLDALDKSMEIGKSNETAKYVHPVNKLENIENKCQETSKVKAKEDVQEDDEGDQISDALPPKGSYTIDFSKFDDPNFDPFNTKTALKTEFCDSDQTSKATISVDKSDVDSVNAKNTAINSLSEEVANINISVGEVFLPNSAANANKAEIFNAGKKLIEEKFDGVKYQSPEEESLAINEEKPVPKGSYSIDFSQFDDPNFNPFQSKKSLVNDENCLLPAPKDHSYLVDLNNSDDDPKSNDSPIKEHFDDFDQNADEIVTQDAVNSATLQDVAFFDATNEEILSNDVQVESTNASTATEVSVKPDDVLLKDKQDPLANEEIGAEDEEIIVPKGAYSMDFSKFDDPNFNPFQTSNSLVNDEDHLNRTQLKPNSIGPDTFGDPKSDQSESEKLLVETPTEEVLVSSKETKISEGLTTVGDLSLPIVDASSQTQKDITSLKDHLVDETFHSPMASPLVKHEAKSNDVSSKEDRRPEQTLANDDTPPGDKEPLPKGAYSIDFSKFDDPNFNPFQTKKSLVNDEDHLNESRPRAGSYSVDLDTFEDPNFDPIKSKKSIVNSPSKETNPSKLDEVQRKNTVESTAQKDEASAVLEDIPEKNLEVQFDHEKSKKSFNASPKAKPKLKKKQKPESLVNDEPTADEEPVPKGAYSIDLSKFDDPNFNPFQTKKSLVNDENPLNEPRPKTGAYSINVNNFDDPNFDPFQSKKSVLNSPTKENTCSMAEDKNILSKNNVVSLDAEDTSTNCYDHEEKIGVANNSTKNFKDQNADENKNVAATPPKSKPQAKRDRKLKKKQKPEPALANNDIPPEEEPIPKGAYSIDFSKFDDPNFNPFQTKKSLVNDEDPLNKPKPKPGAYSNGVDNFVDSFKSKKSVMNSPTKESVSGVDKEKNSVVTNSDIESFAVNGTSLNCQDDAIANKDQNDDNNSSKAASPPKSKPKSKSGVKLKKKQKPNPAVLNDDIPADEEPVPKGAYSIDFSKFDDPNFDPFQTNKSLVNDEDHLNEPKPKPGACSINADKINDPNFDPFKSKKSIMNSPTKENSSGTLQQKSPSSAIVDDSTAVKNTCITHEAGSEKTSANNLIESDKNKTPSPKSKPKGKTGVRIKKKRKPEPTLPQDGTLVEEDPIPKGAYSIDFSNFDDPNFNPFQTKKSLANNEDSSNEPMPKPGSYSIDHDNFNDPNFDPFKSKKSVLNSPTKESGSISSSIPNETASPMEQLAVKSTASDDVDKSNSKPQDKKPVKSKPKTKVLKKKQKSVVEHDQPDKENEEPISKGSYSIDFSQFDDPNFNPFQSKKTLLNDEDPSNAPEPGAYSTDFDHFDDPNYDPFQSKKSMLNSPTKDNHDVIETALDQSTCEDKSVSQKAVIEIEGSNVASNDETCGIKENKEKSDAKAKPKSKVVKKKKKPKPVATLDEIPTEEDPVPKGSYSIDFSKFDDPNFNPFQSKKSLMNDEGNESAPICGSYSTSLNNLDDPNFDPFKSKKSILNSPLKEKSTVNTIESQTDASPTDSNAQETREVADDIVKNTATVEDTQNSAAADKPNKPKSKVAGSKLKKKRKPVKAAKQTSEDEISVSKGSYSIDFSKFDDPNFNPFESKKSLMNKDDSAPEVQIKADSYTMDFDKFDDPNFDPFKSNKSLASDSKVDRLEPKTNNAVSENDAATSKDGQTSDRTHRNLNEPFSFDIDSIDPSLYDDPNFNSFKSSMELANSPTEKQATGEERDMFFDANETFVAEITEGYNSSQADVNKTIEAAKSLLKKKELPRKIVTDEEFVPAEEVFNDGNSMNTWKDFLNKQNENSEAVESELRKKSLYVQFDPLVQPTDAIENAMTEQSASIGLKKQIPNASIKKENSTKMKSTDSEEMHTDQPYHHYASSQLDRNVQGERWDDGETEKTASKSFSLISFSPRDEKTSSLTSADSYLPEGQDRIRYQMMKLLETKEKLLKKKTELRDQISEEESLVDTYESTSKDLEKFLEAESLELKDSKSKQERVIEDIQSANRVYHEYVVKIEDILPTLRGHKEVASELRKMLNKKVADVEEQSAKLEKIRTQARLTASKCAQELAQTRAIAEREVGALQAKLKMEQMAIASLTTALQDKTRENQELTKICDELIAGAEG